MRRNTPKGRRRLQSRDITLRTFPRHGVAADVSRRILSAANMAPTDVGGYAGMKYPS
jgi:hypothetical protein